MLCRSRVTANVISTRPPAARWFNARARGAPQELVVKGAELNAFQLIKDEEERKLFTLKPQHGAPPAGAVIRRSHNAPVQSAGSNFPQQIYAAHPHNFTPLRPVTPGFNSQDRAVRDIAWESRFDLLERGIQPRYAGETIGTPRRELQDGVVGGIRVRPVQNPYVKMSLQRKYPLNSWPSRDWKNWSPLRTHVRGSRRKYRLPEDINPYRDELGEMHPPRVSGRYKADIEKQYYMNSLPWVWSSDYYEGKMHFHDREPRGPKRWYKRDFRKMQIAAALSKADGLVEDYRKERRESKRLSWIETVALEFAGEQLASPFVRTRRVPKM